MFIYKSQTEDFPTPYKAKVCSKPSSNKNIHTYLYLNDTYTTLCVEFLELKVQSSYSTF